MPNVSCFVKMPTCCCSNTKHDHTMQDRVPSVPFPRKTAQDTNKTPVWRSQTVWLSLRVCNTDTCRKKTQRESGGLHFYCNIFIGFWAYTIMTILLAAFPHCNAINQNIICWGKKNCAMLFFRLWNKICFKDLKEKVATVGCNLSSARLGTVSNQ